MRISTSTGLVICTIFTALFFGGCAGHQEHAMQNHSGSGADKHAMHQQMLQAPPESSGSIRAYEVPDLTLINQDRMPVKLTELLNDEQPVLLQFVYATCTTICPVLSAGFSSLQDKLASEAAEVQLVSITIDPEHDNPEVLKNYLANYSANENWDFLTGSRKEIDTVMHAFDTYVSNKMSHKPLTFIKVPGEAKWLRINGLLGSKELYAELRRIHPL